MMQMMQTRLVGCVSQNTGSKLRLELGTTNSSETQSHLRPQNSEPIVTNRITSHQQVTNCTCNNDHSLPTHGCHLGQGKVERNAT